MAALDDGQFWLPPQFLDDDVFVEKSGLKHNNTKGSFSPFDFSYGSDFNSPDESVFGCGDSTEEDVLVAELSNKLAHSTLEHDFPSLYKPTKGWGVSTSPDSTLCGWGCGCRGGSPNGDSEGSTWDLLYAAAGEVARIRFNQQLHAARNNYIRNGHNRYFAPPAKHSPVSPPLDNNQNHSNLALYQELPSSQFNLRRQQMMRRPQHYQSHASLSQNGLSSHNTAANRNNTLLPLSPSAWPSLSQAQTQTQTGSAVRAAFMVNPQAKCVGTGVFLPRRVGAPTEPRKKQGCSTVLLPAKVLHALNLNMDDMGPTPAPPPHHPRLNNREKRATNPQQAVNLPSEWTY